MAAVNRGIAAAVGSNSRTRISRSNHNETLHLYTLQICMYERWKSICPVVGTEVLQACLEAFSAYQGGASNFRMPHQKCL